MLLRGICYWEVLLFIFVPNLKIVTTNLSILFHSQHELQQCDVLSIWVLKVWNVCHWPKCMELYAMHGYFISIYISMVYMVGKYNSLSCKHKCGSHWKCTLFFLLLGLLLLFQNFFAETCYNYQEINDLLYRFYIVFIFFMSKYYAIFNLIINKPAYIYSAGTINSITQHYTSIHRILPNFVDEL